MERDKDAVLIAKSHNTADNEDDRRDKNPYAEFGEDQKLGASTPGKTQFGDDDLRYARDEAADIQEHLHLRRPCVRGREYLHRTHKALGMLPEVFQAKKDGDKFMKKYMLKSTRMEKDASLGQSYIGTKIQNCCDPENIKWYIDHEGRFYFYWHFIIVVCCILSSFLYAKIAAFKHEYPEDSSLSIVNWFWELFFAVDFVL